MSSSDPIALNDCTFKLDRHRWASSTRRTSGTTSTSSHGRLANDSIPVRSGHEHHRADGAHGNIPLAFSPPGFFTDRTYRNTLGNIASVQRGKNYEPPAIPRSATLATEEARLTKDSSLDVWMINGDDATSIRELGDIIKDGMMRGNRLEGESASNSAPSSADQLQLHPISDRTWRASKLNLRSDAIVHTTIHGRRLERGQSKGEYRRVNASLELSGMMELEMDRSVCMPSALTNAQHSSKRSSSKSPTPGTIISSLEYPRLGSFVHLSQEMTDSLSAYAFARQIHDESGFGFKSASPRETSGMTMTEVAVSSPLTAFAATQSTSRKANSGILTASTLTQTGLGSISKTMVGEQPNRSRRGGADSTPLTALEVSQEGLAPQKPYSSAVQCMPSTPLSDYAAAFPAKKSTSSACRFVSPSEPLAALLRDEDGSSVDRGRRESLSPLQDRVQEVTPRRCTPSSSATGHSKSEHEEDILTGEMIERVDSGAALYERDVRAAGVQPHRKPPCPTSHDSTSAVVSPPNQRKRGYSMKDALVAVQQGPVDLTSIGEQQICYLTPWGIVEDWNEIDRFELSVEYII